MRKQAPVMPAKPRPRVGPRPPVRQVLAVLIGLAIAPVVYESSRLCEASWRSMYGQVAHPETPVLDAAGSAAGWVARLARERTRATFANLPWRPSLVISIGIAWAVFTSLPLRRRAI